MDSKIFRAAPQWNGRFDFSDSRHARRIKDGRRSGKDREGCIHQTRDDGAAPLQLDFWADFFEVVGQAAFMFARVICVLVMAAAAQGAEPVILKRPSMAEVLAASQPGDWRVPDPENVLYLDLASGRVVIELAPLFAPNHVANVKALAREHYFDGLAILRCQDNYVVQWGDPNAEKPELAREIDLAHRTLAPEFDRPLEKKLAFTPLPDGDVYAREVGFWGGFPVARDPKSKRMWLVHEYGMVGAGRDVAVDSGGGTELYVVIGHSPRHLDRNVTLLGRVLQGMELLSALPRGPAPMGFYEKPEQRVPIKSVRVAADVPAEERTALEVLRTDTAVFKALIESRRNRPEAWYHSRAGKIEIGNVPIPVRTLINADKR
jgi:peptidylprolyl isomerase